MPMNPEIKAQWVAALRSGEYQQGRAQLSSLDGSKHCCLGVLCQLAIKAGQDIEVATGNEGIEYDENGYFLPDSVAHWAGLFRGYTGPDGFHATHPADSPDVLFDGEQAYLSELNDGKEKVDQDGDVVIGGGWIRKPLDFLQIADLIENDPEL